MKTTENNLDHLRKENPFKLPEGYMENLTEQIMNGLPEKEMKTEAPRVTLMEKVKPWLYMAAIFAGLGLFFKAIIGPVEKTSNKDLVVQSDTNTTIIAAPKMVQVAQTIDSDEYLEYIEDRYASDLLADDIVGFE